MASLVNHSVSNLINGVSQQAPSVRLDNQLEEQINCFSDVTKGLTIRNGLELKNVIDADLSNRQNLEFNIDGVKYVIGIDSEDATPAVHIPLTADVSALASSITGDSYFKDIAATDLRVVENKDFVYILNKSKKVGTNNLIQAFFDIKLINDGTGLTDTDWDTGTYTITIDGVADPDTATVAAETADILVTDAMTPSAIAALINAETALLTETGQCYIIGNKGNYRLVFESIPENYITPDVTVVETTTLQGVYSYQTITPWTFDTDNRVVKTSVTDAQFGFTVDTWSFNYAGVLKGSVASYDGSGKSLKDGADIYERGYEASSGLYAIRLNGIVSGTADYTLSISSPETVVGAEYTVDKFADEGMIWVTGVASNQTYDIVVEYENAAGTPQIPITLTTISVGTTVSNIKLNWVAGQIETQLDAATHFTADTYDNAVHFYSTTEYAYNITAIKVSNNFDTSSISSVVKATVDNENAITEITDLPPTFIDGFKLRVGALQDNNTDYYLRYESSFQGWKECGLDETRILDSGTMPYVIDKNKVRKTGTIVIEPTSWERSFAGDALSNPYPSFVDRTINDIFFYGSRLGLVTDDSLILSAIDKPTTFFRSTNSQIIGSDRVDIKLDSSKTGFNAIKDVVTYDGKLLVNTGSVQSVLLVNNAFDLSSARLSEVSSYTLGENKPLPVENGLYFALENNGFTNIYDYQAAGNNTYQAVNVTRHVPTYINGTVNRIQYANNFTVCGIVEDKSVLYVQNRYTENGQVLQNAWHKWVLPYDVEDFIFDDNDLYVFMTAVDDSLDTYTLSCKYDLTPQVVTESNEDAFIGWIPYLDCWTKDKTLIDTFSEFIGVDDKFGGKYVDVATAYADTLVNQIDLGAVDGPYYNTSSPIYYWEIDGNTNDIIWNDGTVITFGNSSISIFDDSGYRYTRGDETVDTGFYEVSREAITVSSYYKDDIVYGIPFTPQVTLSEIVPRQQSQDGFVVMNYAKLLLRRMVLLLNKSGVFDVAISFADRPDYVVSYKGQPLGKALLGRKSVADIGFKFPINGKSDKITITLSSDTAMPFNLLSIEWQGQLTTRGRNI